MGTKIAIDSDDYYEILSEVGYPIVPESALEYNKEAILKLVVLPSMREYWSWFPIEQVSSIFIAGNDFSIPYPTLTEENHEVIGVTDARLATRQQSSSDTGSTFLNAILTQIRGVGKYGTEYDYGYDAARWSRDAYQRSSQNSLRALRLHVYPDKKIVSGFANVTGEIIVTWAIGSTSFNDIPFSRKTEVLNLCKSKILGLFYRLRAQIDSGTGVNFNGDVFKDRSNDLETRVLTKWREFSKVTIVKS